MSNGQRKSGIGSYAKLRGYRSVEREDDFDEIFNQMATELRGRLTEVGSLQVVIGSREDERTWVLDLAGKECESRAGKIEEPRFQIKTKPSTASAILAGRVSPVLAIARGDLRVKGDLDFGITLFELLGGEGRKDPCRIREGKTRVGRRPK